MNKFFARKTPCAHGHSHASAKEARRCADLHLMERAGAIAGLQVEPKYVFEIGGKPVVHTNGRKAVYTPDFSYVENGRKVCEDVKGGNATKTEASTLRLAFARAMWPSIDWRVL
jgi:hypothetical protein